MRIGTWSRIHSRADALVLLNRSIPWALALGLIVLPSLTQAQEKDQVRDQAKAVESQMRALGEPRDRCSLGANIHDGPVVIRTNATTVLKPGDRLLVLNQVNIAGKSPDDVIAMLRDIAPTARIPMTVDRDGQLIDLELPCVNARQTIEPMMNALGFAARGKFDDCANAISEMSDVDTRTAMLKVQCAAVSRNAKKYDVPALLAQAMNMAIEDARYSASLRPEVVKQLRNVEGAITQGLGAARFRSLVESTRSWPGGEKLFDESGPDWALFRRNAENALRARLIDPESARIDWTHGFLLGSWKPFMSKRIDGYWTCGLVNARNRMGGYTGSTAFVVVLDSSGYVQYAELGQSKDFDVLTASCNNSAKLLPPRPSDLLATVNAQATHTAAPVSMADELKKLVELKNSGALSEAEFQAAKQRLLGTSPQ